MRRLGAAAAASVLVLTLAACGSDSDGAADVSASGDDTETTTTLAGESDPTTTVSPDGPTECAEAAPLESGILGGKPTSIDIPSTPPSGEVTVTVLREGDGPEVTSASYVTAHYVGVACSTGEQFDSSWDNGAPIGIALPDAAPTATAFNVIQGWNDGLLGQKQGSLVQIDIPSDLAYGPQGSPPVIAPNDPLTFVVDILEVSDEPPAG